MNKALIELGNSVICNFDYFCIDSTETTFTLGKRIFEKGQSEKLLKLDRMLLLFWNGTLFMKLVFLGLLRN